MLGQQMPALSAVSAAPVPCWCRVPGQGMAALTLHHGLTLVSQLDMAKVIDINQLGNQTSPSSSFLCDFYLFSCPFFSFCRLQHPWWAVEFAP